ncbi:MAG TPA: hydroxymethylbilane synthase, partial [Verrucomicrobiales bacterium]|nr:hydroxymethylbilane synthase [Verrucomicrobiales bacterium]
TGDKLQTASLANPGAKLPKGLFTKELEVALLEGEAGLAVHSLKDLPTELPDGLALGAVTEREDARDVVIAREPCRSVTDLPEGAVVASSSPRRMAQLRQLRPDTRGVEIRGNVGTRLRKIAEQTDLHATLLAMAGMKRLGYTVGTDGRLAGPDVPAGLFALPLAPEEMIPAVGQAAIGLEIRADDPVMKELCARLNHADTWHCVTAERAFLRAMGGGCLSPVAGHAVIRDGRLHLMAVSFQTGSCHTATGQGEPTKAAEVGRIVAAQIDAPKLA